MNVPEPTPTLYVLISVSDPDGSDFFADPNPDLKNPGMDPYLLRKKKFDPVSDPRTRIRNAGSESLCSLSLSLKPTGRPKVNTPESPALHTSHLTRHILFNSSSSTLIIPLHIRIIYEYNHAFSSYSSSTYPFLILLY